MEVAESAAGLLIYKELDYSCIHGGNNFSSISKFFNASDFIGIKIN
jgi:hypothetical protein